MRSFVAAYCTQVTKNSFVLFAINEKRNKRLRAFTFDSYLRLNRYNNPAGYEKATGDRNKVALIGVGLNPKARTVFLQDSIAEGTVTLAIGGNDDVGGANKTDFYFPGVLTKATMTVDGHVIVKNGKLVS